MRLIIEGSKKYLELIKRENRLRALKNGLKMTIEEKIKEQKPKADEKPIETPMSKKTNTVKKSVKKGK